MNKRLILSILTAVIVLAPTGPGALAATTAKKTAAKPAARTYTRIFYTMDNKPAKASLRAHANSIDILAPQSYAIDANGALTGHVSTDTLAFAKTHKIKVMPLVVNKGFSTAASHAFLDDTAKQDAAIAALAAEGKKNGYWGWQIDFEQIDLAYRDRFSAFVARAHSALAAQGQTLSVAVIAQVSENPNDYKNTLWQDLVGAYDYKALASSTDLISIMSYDDPESTGPVAEYAWLQRVLNFALQYIPANKLSLGIPLYYWQWDDAAGKRVAIGNSTAMNKILSKHKTVFHYSLDQQAPYFTFKSNKKSYTVWYENGRSLAQKIALVKARGLHGISAWALGQEVPSVWTAL